MNVAEFQAFLEQDIPIVLARGADGGYRIFLNGWMIVGAPSFEEGVVIETWEVKRGMIDRYLREVELRLPPSLL